MKFQPNIQKLNFKKFRKGSIKSFEKKANQLKFAKYGIKALKSFRMTLSHMETCRISLNKKLKVFNPKGKNKIWFRIYPFRSVTRKPREIRMGKGKGSVDQWVAIVKSGQILFEFDTLDLKEENLSDLSRVIESKLPSKMKMIVRKF